MLKKFGKSKLEISFKEVFKIVKVFDDDIPEFLKVSVAMGYLKCRSQKDFKLWLDYIKGEDTKTSGDRRTISLIHDFPRIRNSVAMLWGIDLEVDDIEWSKGLSLVNDCVLMNTPISEIVKIRTMDISDVKDPILRSKILQAKREVALPPVRHKDTGNDTGDLFRMLVNKAQKNK